MRRAARTRSNPSPSSSLLIRWGRLGALLSGVLFVTWGYVHREDDAPAYFDTVANTLSVVVPLLFVVGLRDYTRGGKDG